MDLWTLGLPTVALASVALLGYLVGRWANQLPGEPTHPELKRARAIIRDLEMIAQRIRRDLAQHEGSLAKFKRHVGLLSRESGPANWLAVAEEAERLLRPTQELAGQMARAYEGIRQQAGHLTSFAAVQTDSLTGVGNRQVFDTSLADLLAMRAEFGSVFSLAIFDIDHFQQLNNNHGRLHGDHVLQRLAWLLDHNVRETDVVGRLGGEEFAVLLPGTDLLAAAIFAERIRRAIPEMIHVTVSVGVTTVFAGDDAKTIVGRAEAALFGAKAAGRNVAYLHDGNSVQAATSARPTEEMAPPLAENVA